MGASASAEAGPEQAPPAVTEASAERGARQEERTEIPGRQDPLWDTLSV